MKKASKTNRNWLTSGKGIHRIYCGVALICVAMVLGINGVCAKEVTILNVSYDPTRELYQEVNPIFSKEWKAKTGDDLTIKQSHGGSGKQARSVIDGLEADVVTLALAYDIDALVQNGHRVTNGWQKHFPYNSTPYTSTIVFLVRKGNPKQIKDWDDLTKPGVSIIPANPKTSGAARWAYLAAWGYALKKSDNNQSKAKDFVTKFYRNAPVLDAGARGATTTFIQRQIGDVLVGWENEALIALNELGKGQYEIVYPSLSILAEPPVAIVDQVVDKRGTRNVAEAYLQFLYSDVGQQIAAKHYFRPRSESILAEHRVVFPKINLFTIDDVFGGWQNAQKAHFADGGTFDQISKSNR